MSAGLERFCKPDPCATSVLDALAQERIEDSLSRAGARLAEAVEAAAGDDATLAVGAWFGAKSLWTRLSEPSRAALRTHPCFRYFLHRMLHDGDAADCVAFSMQLPTLCWTAALAHHLRWSGEVVLDYRGGLRAPGAARHIEFGADRAHARPHMVVDADCVVFAFPDGLIVQAAAEDIDGAPADAPDLEEHGYAVRRCPRIGRTALVVNTRDQWLRVRLTGTNQRRDGAAFDGLDDERYVDDPPLSNIDAALGLIDAVWPEELDDLSSFVRVIVPFRAASRTHAAFTVSSRQGAIFLGGAPPRSTAEAIVQEAAHVKLRQLQLIDTLLAAPLDESERVQVPWRPDPRPLPGVFEGVFVFAHVAELMRRLAAEGSRPAKQRYEHVRRDLEAGAALVRERAALTPEGARFFAALCEWI